MTARRSTRPRHQTSRGNALWLSISRADTTQPAHTLLLQSTHSTQSHKYRNHATLISSNYIKPNKLSTKFFETQFSIKIIVEVRALNWLSRIPPCLSNQYATPVFQHTVNDCQSATATATDSDPRRLVPVCNFVPVCPRRSTSVDGETSAEETVANDTRAHLYLDSLNV